jgi:hypothetical protein
MRRPLLLSLMVLGLITTAIGGVGVFAPFTDRATTGTNNLTSGERPRGADLQIVWPAQSFWSCDGETFVNDSTSSAVVANDAQPGYQVVVPFCLRNAGSLELTITGAVIDVVNRDVECTGDEAAAGDATCGNNEVGELGSVIATYIGLGPCDTGSAVTFAGFVSDAPTLALGTLAAGATACGAVEVFYPLNRPDVDVLQAQTDQVTWKFAFDGTSS